MFELRAAVGGIVLSVEVDEGQTVAELDDIVTLNGSDGTVRLATEVPGVVRELYVEPGTVIGAGAVIALIDES